MMTNLIGFHIKKLLTLPKAYAFAFKWIEDNGYLVSDNPRESYIDGIWNQEAEENWLTELQILVVKK